MQLGRLPVSAREAELPVIPMNRWRLEGSPSALTKTFGFMRKGDRNKMLEALFDHEDATQHHAVITIEEDTLKISLLTKNVEQVTELDKEYAKFADQAYKDVVYAPNLDHLKGYM
jgi:pterin-4a-carbinolamine dehydratase